MEHAVSEELCANSLPWNPTQLDRPEFLRFRARLDAHMKWLIHLSISLFALSSVAADTIAHHRRKPGTQSTRGPARAHQDPRLGQVRGARTWHTREDLSVEYITAQFKKLGLKRGIQTEPTRRKSRSRVFSPPDRHVHHQGNQDGTAFAKEFVAFTQRITPTVEVRHSDMVFVGYGIVAPEYGWDDFKGMDVKARLSFF